MEAWASFSFNFLIFISGFYFVTVLQINSSTDNKYSTLNRGQTMCHTLHICRLDDALPLVTSIGVCNSGGSNPGNQLSPKHLKLKLSVKHITLPYRNFVAFPRKLGKQFQETSLVRALITSDQFQPLRNRCEYHCRLLGDKSLPTMRPAV